MLPFGLTKTPMTFMRLMHGMFHPFLEYFVLIFIDDILIHCKNQEEHKENLRIVLEMLRKHHLYDKFSKCDFFKAKIST